MSNTCLLFFSVCFLLTICGYKTCSKLEFIQGSEHTVSVVGSIVNITFRLDTHQCQSNQTSYSVTVSRSVNGSHLDICKIRLEDKCFSSPSSSICSCLSPDGPMLFSKNVSSDDNNAVYIWKWKDKIREQNKKVTFQIYNFGRTTPVADSTTDLAHSTDVADRITDVAESTTDIAESPTFESSILVVISSLSSGGGVLLVTGLIVIAACICRRRGRSQVEQNPSPSHSYASSSIHCQADSEQTKDIYEQIEEPLEMCTDHKATSRSGVKLSPSANVKLQSTPRSTLVNQSEIPICQTYPDGYLHPLYLPGERLEQKVEFKTMHSVDLPPVKPKASRSSV